MELNLKLISVQELNNLHNEIEKEILTRGERKKKELWQSVLEALNRYYHETGNNLYVETPYGSTAEILLEECTNNMPGLLYTDDLVYN